MTSPCKDCPDRHAHCHSACNRYGEYAAMLEKIRAQRLADAAADAADAERGIKIRRDVRKYGLYKNGGAAMTVSKFCEKCGKMMWDVQPCKRFCDTCIKEKARQKAKLNYEKKKAQQQGVISAMQAKKPDKKAVLKPRIKSIEQCVREAAALCISYGQYVQRGYDKE